MASAPITATQALVLLGRSNGITLIPAGTPLTRLNYFDGKFLRAEDLRAEQTYLRRLVQLSNQAGGAGVVHGFELTLAGGDGLVLSPGLAIDPAGRVLLLPQDHAVSIADLIERSREAARVAAAAAARGGTFAECETVRETPPAALAARTMYLVTIAHAEALCGEEDVYGKLCEEACITSTDRPNWIEGVVLRARPLTLDTPLAESAAIALGRTHLRSRVAGAYFADEAKRVAHLISGAGLRSDAWCAGADALTGSEVPLGVLLHDGARWVLDLWTARRERMETPPQRYWHWRMAMRPWDVFLAQVLQFQCQVRDAFDAGSVDGDDDPCNEAKRLVAETAGHIDLITRFYRDTAANLASFTGEARKRLFESAPDLAGRLQELDRFQERITAAADAFRTLPQDRLLIRRGIVETPSAGYLPVTPGATVTVNDQVRRMLGDGVDLRFCIVRADYVAHALEEARHMERISLLEGIDHPDRKPKVDVLVPDGTVAPGRDETGQHYEMRMNVIPDNLLPVFVSAALGKRFATAARTNALNAAPQLLAGLFSREGETYRYVGAARGEAVPGRGIAFHYAGLSDPFELEPAKSAQPQEVLELHRSVLALSTGSGEAATRAAAEVDRLATTSELLRLSVDPRRFWIAEEGRVREVRSSIWVSLEIADDPTGLARGGQTRVRGEAYLLVVRPAFVPKNENEKAASEIRHLLIRGGFTGDLRVERVEARRDAADTVAVDGELAGELTLTLSVGEAVESRTLHLSEPVRLLRSPGTHGPTWRLQMREPSALGPLVAGLDVERRWTAPGQAEARGTVDFRKPDEKAVAELERNAARRLSTNLGAVSALGAATVQDRQLFRAWQSVNPAVAEPAHPAHERAIRALRAIGSALGASRFADVKAAALFPAPKPRQDGLVLLATRDWVLFHRRRDKTCHEVAGEAPAATRSYGLYQVAVRDARDIDRLQKAVAANDAATLAKFEPDFLQVVDFAASVQSVLTPHAQVRATWRQDVGIDAGAIAGGVIASGGIAVSEGKALARERLEALVDVLDTEFAVADSPDWAVVERVPEFFDAARQDGVILLATLKAPAQTNCHDVYAIEVEAELNAIAEAAGSGRIAEALAGSKTVKPLGKVNFTGSVPVTAELEAMKAQWPADYGKATRAVLALAKDDPAAATYPAQSAVLLSTLGGNGTPMTVASPTAMPACPAVTLVLGDVVFRNALLLYALFDGGLIIPQNPTTSPISFRNDLPQGDALANYLGRLTPSQPVGRLFLTTRQALDAGAATRLERISNGLVAAGKPPVPPTQRTQRQMTTADRNTLTGAGFDPDGFDEVIWFVR